jgi:hypothetical protein
LPQYARKHAQIHVLGYPGAQQSAILGMRDLMDFAANLTEARGTPI